MSHYRTNLEDLFFNIFDVYGYTGEGSMFDEDAVRDILTEVDRLAREDIAASFEAGDRFELRLERGGVALPEEMTAALDAVYGGGWHTLGIEEEIGGMDAPGLLNWAAAELLVGANPAAFFYTIGSAMAAVIAKVGTEEQIRRYAVPMIENAWGGTMALTEADAGSDVGAGRTVAHDNSDGTWTIEGAKRFITSGEYDYPDNIIHLVLARPEGAGPGTKGLSMFIVPKYLVNEDGTLGARNGVETTTLEHKMGIRGSATCELTFSGGDTPALGYLAGGVHNGIRQMFEAITSARMLIGVKSTATISTGYLNAVEYAKERLQGTALADAGNPNAEKVAIIKHPDVRRLLLEQKAHAEGLRALYLYSAWLSDQEAALDEGDTEGRKRARRRASMLLPIVKGYASEAAARELTHAMQVLGGSGYTADYPIEQYIRDAHIDPIYEGTTGIQALDLLFRNIARDQGQTLIAFIQELMAYAEKRDDDPVAEARAVLKHIVEDSGTHVSTVLAHAMAQYGGDPGGLGRAGLHANAVLYTLAETIISWLWVRQMEAVASRDDSFAEGKRTAGRWWLSYVQPRIQGRIRAAGSEDGSLLSMEDDAF